MRRATLQRVVVAAVVAAATLPASAAEWVQLYQGRAGEQQYFDSSSVATMADGDIKVWVKVEFDDAQGESYEEKYKHAKRQMLVRCQNRSFALLREVTYVNKSGSGRLTASRTYDYPKYVDPIPETVGDSIVMKFCPTAQQKPVASPGK